MEILGPILEWVSFFLTNFHVVPPYDFCLFFMWSPLLFFCSFSFLFCHCCRMVRRALIDVTKAIDFDAIRLKQLFEFSVDDAISFLVCAGALKNRMNCDNCGSQMNVQKRSKQPDGIWVSFGFFSV
jgi:hypothetical protein